jgi:hypothetical protein
MQTTARARLILCTGLLTMSALAAAPTAAQTSGCQTDISGRAGAQLTAQVLQPDPRGTLVTVGSRASEVEVRSSQVLRLIVRPLEGPANPTGAGCPVRVSIGRFNPISVLLTTEGFVFDRGFAYGQFRAGEERSLDFEIRTFDDWTAVYEDIEIDGMVIVRLPQTSEFIARLPSTYQPPPGTVCADVVYPDAEPAAGVVLNLAAPPEGPADSRATGEDGRACWDGFDDLLYGDLSVDASFTPALGQPRSRYVSPAANYRLFVVKRPG